MYVSLYYFLTVDTVEDRLMNVFLISKETVRKLDSLIGVSFPAFMTIKQIL
jgi:hypothetical protein